MLLAIDQGTTGTTCLVFDLNGELLGRDYREFPQYFPVPGWVEHDLDEIWDSVVTVIKGALDDAGAVPGELAAIGITNQRETIACWDRGSGESLYRAQVWQDRRTTDRCEELVSEGWGERLRAKTGLMVDPYFSATKIEWLMKNVDGLAGKVHAGRAVFGTIDTWLTFKLTGEFVTDLSNASRTQLVELSTASWDEELLDLFEVPRNALPEIKPSAGEFAYTDPNGFLGERIPVSGIAGDQQASLFGQGCIEPGFTKNTYGTGSFVLMNAGTAVPALERSLLTTVAWQIGRTVTYALEAPIFTTGAAVQWLRDGLGLIENAAQSEAMARSISSNDGVYFVPALTGLGAPYWDPRARGTITGLTRGTTGEHLVRAALEAIAYQTVDAVRAMEESLGISLPELRVDGGAVANSWLMQFQADLLGIPVVLANATELTAKGAAMLAGVGANILTIDQVSGLWEERRRYEPEMGADERQTLLRGWRAAVAKSLEGERDLVA
jgi:glycerol kinase